jgi:hypothetical protein
MYHVIILHVDDVMSHEESRHPNTRLIAENKEAGIPIDTGTLVGRIAMMTAESGGSAWPSQREKY